MAVRTTSRQVGKHVYYYAKTEESLPKVGEGLDVSPSFPSETLPDEFTNYLRTLFNILDSKGRGFIRLSEVEQRWSGGDSGAVPSGIIISLRKVASKNGLLTFENLCNGLKLALRGQSHHSAANGILKSPKTESEDEITSPVHTVKAVPVHIVTEIDESSPRSSSLPQLSTQEIPIPRANVKRRNSKKERTPSFVDRLRGWHHERRQTIDVKGNKMTNATEEGALLGGQTSPSTVHKNGTYLNRSVSDTKVFYDNSPDTQQNSPVVNARITKNLGPKKEAKLRQLDEENGVLQDGRDAVEKARRWFFQRITAVQEERLHILESENYSPEETHYEMLMDKNRREELQLTTKNFEVYKQCVKKLNQQMILFVDNPRQMVLQEQENSDAKKLKDLEEANKKLEQELKEKREKIVQLESDKQNLIKEMFESKSRRGRPRPLSASRVKAW